MEALWKGRWAIPGAGGLLLTAAFLFPNPAQAGCNNHQLALARQGLNPAQTPFPPAGKVKSDPIRPLPSGPPSRPCSGPHCSQGEIPPPAPAPLVPVGGEHWVILERFDNPHPFDLSFS